MKMKQFSLIGKIFLFFSFLILFFNCTGSQQSVVKHSPQKKITTRRVVLLPVVDRRKEKTPDLQLDVDIRVPAIHKLEKKGYEVMYPDFFLSDGSRLSDEELANLKLTDLYEMGPAEENIILLIFLDNYYQESSAIKLNAKLELTGIMLDKKGKKILWQHKGVGENNAFGIAATALKKEMGSNPEFERAVSDLFSTLPKAK